MSAYFVLYWPLAAPTGRGSGKRLQRFRNRAANSRHGVSELSFRGGAAAGSKNTRPTSELLPLFRAFSDEIRS